VDRGSQAGERVLHEARRQEGGQQGDNLLSSLKLKSWSVVDLNRNMFYFQMIYEVKMNLS